MAGHYTDAGPIELNPHVHVNKKHADIRGQWGTEFHVRGALVMLAKHRARLPFARIAGGRYALGEAGRALDDVEARRVAKALVVPTLLLACALLILGACRRDQAEGSRSTSTAATASASIGISAAAVQDTGFGPATRAVQRVRRSPRGILQAARATSHPGYDRVVFEFAGDSLPGYRVEYARGPAVRCGSGDPVALAGTGRLVVRFEPAQAHDARGNPTAREREATPGLPALKDMKLVCDFEGQVEWALGVASAGPYRVLEMAAPGRLVLDVRHGP